jgi:guanylate kinase
MMNPREKRKRSESKKRMKTKMSESRKKMKRMSKFKKMMMMNPQTKRKITLHLSEYFSEPSSLETPIKYEY